MKKKQKRLKIVSPKTNRYNFSTVRPTYMILVSLDRSEPKGYKYIVSKSLSFIIEE